MVRLRFATWEELPRLATIATAAFEEDPIYLHFNPWRSVYPEDWRDGFLRTLQWRFAEPGSVVIVAEVEDEREDGTRERTIVAYLTATRRGTDGKPSSSWLQQQNELGIHVATPEQQREAQQSRSIPNRSANPEAIAQFYAEETRILGGSLASTLEGQTFAVLPEYQRRGIGKVFTRWSMDMAEAEGVSWVGDASRKGIDLYVRMGVKVQGAVVLEKKILRLQEGTDSETVVELPRLEVPIFKWVPGWPRAAGLGKSHASIVPRL